MQERGAPQISVVTIPHPSLCVWKEGVNFDPARFSFKKIYNYHGGDRLIISRYTMRDFFFLIFSVAPF